MVKINYLDDLNNRQSIEGDYLITGNKAIHVYVYGECILNLNYDKITKIF